MTILQPMIAAAADPAKVPWAEGLVVSLPPHAAPGADSVAALDRLRLARAFTDLQPTSSRLPFSYQSVPMGLIVRPARSKRERSSSLTYSTRLRSGTLWARL